MSQQQRVREALAAHEGRIDMVAASGDDVKLRVDGLEVSIADPFSRSPLVLAEDPLATAFAERINERLERLGSTSFDDLLQLLLVSNGAKRQCQTVRTAAPCACIIYGFLLGWRVHARRDAPAAAFFALTGCIFSRVHVRCLRLVPARHRGRARPSARRCSLLPEQRALVVARHEREPPSSPRRQPGGWRRRGRG